MRKIVLVLVLWMAIMEHGSAKLYITTRDIVIKKKKQQHSMVVGVVKKGASLDVEEFSEGSYWAKVNYNGKQGFIKTKFLAAAPEEPPAQPAAESSRWSTTKTLTFVGIVIASLLVLKSLVQRIKRYLANKSKGKASPSAAIQKPTHWYQCKQCRVAVKRHKPPSGTGCVNGNDHNWIELAEVGANKYFCRHCATIVSTASMPVSHGCPGSDTHYWTQLG